MQKLISLAILAIASVVSAANDLSASAIHPRCLSGSSARTQTVTHYMIPLLERYDHQTCHLMEGTCIFKKSGVPYLYNFGHGETPLSQARCKNGYGNKNNCLHPCRTVAASMKHHRFGQVLYLPNLVGHKCGNKSRDGFEMIHDGFVVVGDTGSPKYFNKLGRLDFFWGRCANRKSGICREGAQPISDDATTSNFCMVWDPSRPNQNADIREDFIQQIKAEAIARGDKGAADDFDL